MGVQRLRVLNMVGVALRSQALCLQEDQPQP